MEVDRRLIEELGADADAVAVAEAAGLRYVHDDEPGLRRRVRGRGFSYVRADGTVAGDAERQRIESLAIPPAWTDVWISTDPDAHLLVTGIDDAGRKQYLYHQRWREARDLQKFERLATFGDALIELRRSVAADLRRRGLPVERVAAAVVRLIDSRLVRVGNERYAEDNETFGVTTLQRQHVRSAKAGLSLCFNGKGGRAHRLVVDDRGVGTVIEACLEQRGPQLFCAVVDGGPVPVTAPLVNEYLHRLGGEHVTAKDFRTWGATAIATGVLGPIHGQASGAAADDADHHVLTALDAAADALGNTRAVCRSSYVAPAVLAAYRGGELSEDCGPVGRADGAAGPRSPPPSPWCGSHGAGRVSVEDMPGIVEPMTKFGLTLSSEEHEPKRLVEIAKLAEESGFDFVSISDHYHPWVDAQGHSPFVWSVLGAIAASTDLIDVAVGVTCPIMRIHPAVLAQATATTAQLLEGRFTWGVGTGEALNEHILGDRWPPAPKRLEMLQEALEIVRRLWEGDSVTFEGRHYLVENARVYDPPRQPPPVIVSAFGLQAAAVAARCGDGLWVSGPDEDVISRWRDEGGTGPVYNQLTLCWAEDRDEAIELAHRTWPNSGVPGQLSQDLPTPVHFEQASSTVTPEMIADSIPCGPEPAPIAAEARKAVDAGVDHLYFHQIGDDQEGFCRLWQEELEPELTK